MGISCVKKLPAKPDAKLRKESGRSTVRALAGARKGAFVLTPDATHDR
jgi:hypothetical protein